MKKPKKPPAKAAARPPIAERALAGIRQAGAYRRGEHVPGLVVRKPVDVKAVREKIGMSQVEFSKAFGFSIGAIRDWEQGRATPEMANTTLMHAIIMDPELIKRAAKAAKDEREAA